MTTLVADETTLRTKIEPLARASRIALDIESNGLFKYRASLCTIQIGHGHGEEQDVVVVDARATSIAALGPLFGPSGPRKIVHDVAFDARILAEAGVVLGNVLDTSIAARMLGRTATGLASLLQGELGIALDKKLQHHDWTERPILAHQLRYLADDVVHLEALATKLWTEVCERGIADEVEEETRYRVAQATLAARTLDPRPPWIRLKGVDRAKPEERPILRRLADVREDKARELDVPPYKVLGPDVIFAVAKARPKTMDDLGKIKGATSGHRARALAPSILEAVAAGERDDGVPEAEAAMLARPHVPHELARARRERETRLTSWRKAEAKRRGVDEQVVLPGHCLQEIAGAAPETLEAIAAVPGIGAFRVSRDGAAMLTALAGAPKVAAKVVD